MSEPRIVRLDPQDLGISRTEDRMHARVEPYVDVVLGEENGDL